MMKEDILENQDRRKHRKIKRWVNAEIFPSLEFSKLCWMVEAKIVTLSAVVLNVYRGNM